MTDRDRETQSDRLRDGGTPHTRQATSSSYSRLILTEGRLNLFFCARAAADRRAYNHGLRR
jgi:hypothetical protein